MPRGQTLAAPGTVSVTRRADVRIDLLPGSRALKHGARLHLHHGTAEVLGRVSVAGQAQTEVPAGGTALARLRLEAPAVLTRGDRVILRSYSPPFTIGAATVLDPAPTAPGIRSDAGLHRVRELEDADPPSAFAAMVRDRGLRGVPVAHAVARAGIAPADVGAAVGQLEKAGAVVRVGDRLVSAVSLATAGDEVKDRLQESALGLSGGQQQRLCIARAIAIQPEIILMDEPASALDPIATGKIEDLILDLKKNFTIVIVTHNMQQAARISDQTAFFYLGELIEYDSTRKIFTNPAKRQTEDYVTGRFG